MTAHRALLAEGHALPKKSQISLGATDTILCVRKGDMFPGAGYRERPGLVVPLGGKETHDHRQIQNIIEILPNNGVRPARCATTREKPEHSREEENVGREAQRKSQERYSRRLQSVAAYHDLQHAIVLLDDLISNMFTVGVQTSSVRILRANRRLVRDVSARLVGRSTSLCSTLRTLVRPTARSLGRSP